MSYRTDDLRIQGTKEVIAPQDLHAEFPVSDAASATVHDARSAIHPCSVSACLRSAMAEPLRVPPYMIKLFLKLR